MTPRITLLTQEISSQIHGIRILHQMHEQRGMMSLSTSRVVIVHSFCVQKACR